MYLVWCERYYKFLARSTSLKESAETFEHGDDGDDIGVSMIKFFVSFSCSHGLSSECALDSGKSKC